VATRTEQAQLNAFGRRIAEALQHGEVTVPTADEKKISPSPHYRDTLRRFVSQGTAMPNPSDWEPIWKKRSTAIAPRPEKRRRSVIRQSGRTYIIRRQRKRRAPSAWELGKELVRRRPLGGRARQRLGAGQDADPREAPCETSSLIRGVVALFHAATSTTSGQSRSRIEPGGIGKHLARDHGGLPFSRSGREAALLTFVRRAGCVWKPFG